MAPQSAQDGASSSVDSTPAKPGWPVAVEGPAAARENFWASSAAFELSVPLTVSMLAFSRGCASLGRNF